MDLPTSVSLALLQLLLLAQTNRAHANILERQSSNPDISSGTCYYGAGQEADPSYIPCGNTAYGNFHCCQAGANCLDHNACYAGGITYVAGCTDPSYQDPSCPTKGIYADQQWSGLVYCNGTSDEWTLCDDSAVDSNVPETLLGCYCPQDEGSRNIAFSAGDTIANQLSLPSSAGDTMSVFAGYTLGTVLTSATSSASPTTASSIPAPPATTSISSNSPTTSATSSATSTADAPTPSATSSSLTTSGPTSFSTSTSSPTSSSSSSSAGVGGEAAQATSSPGSSLSTGAKAGIGIGAALGGIALIALLGFIALCFRRRQRRSMVESDAVRPHPEAPPMAEDGFTALPQRSADWSNNRSELPGDESTLASSLSPVSAQKSWSRPMSEVEGSAPTYQSMASHQSQELSDTRTGYRPYRRAEMAPARVQPSSTASQASYQPGRHVESGLFEMPASLPGSTLMY